MRGVGGRSRVSVATCDDPDHDLRLDRVLADSGLANFIARLISGHVEVRSRPEYEPQLSVITALVDNAVSDLPGVCKR